MGTARWLCGDGRRSARCCHRELEEETRRADVYLEQLFTFGEPNATRALRVITVACAALLSADQMKSQQLRRQQ